MPSRSIYHSQCLQICIILCLSGMSIWPVVKGYESSCICEEEDDQICKCLERYVTRSEFSNFKSDLDRKQDAQMYQLISRIQMLEDDIQEYRHNMPLLLTEIKKREEIVSNISKRVDKLQEENKLLKEQLSEEKRYRRSLEDNILFLDEWVNQTGSWLNNMNVTGTDMQVLEKAVRLLGEEKLQQLAHIVGSYTVEVVELKVVNSRDKSKHEKSKVFISVIETQNDTFDGNDNVVSPETEVTGEEISRYVENITIMFNSKIQDLEERLKELANNQSTVLQQFSTLEENFINHKQEMSDVISSLNSSVITYEILEQLIKDVTSDILRIDTAFIGINVSDTIGVSSEMLEEIFMNMLEKGSTIELPNISVDYGFYFKTYTSHPRLISLLEGIKLLLGTAVINVRADMETIMIEHTRTTEDTHANRTVELHQQIDSITNNVKEIMANHSIFEAKYQENVEVTQKMNLFNNQTLERLMKVEDAFSEAMGNLSNLVETNMIQTTEQLDRMWMELNASNQRFDQLEEKTINVTKRLNNTDTNIEDLLTIAYYLSEETKSLKTSMDDAMFMVNDLQRNSSFYASVLDIERMANVTKELGSAIDVVQEDYLPALQERIYTVEMDISDIIGWKNMFFSGINTTEPTSTEDTRTKLPTETPKYCSPITIEHPNLNVSDGESFFTFTSENERQLEFLPVGSIIYLFCQPVGKYEIIGKNVLSCDQNGQWDGEVPSCHKLKDQQILKALLKGEKCPEPNGTFPHPKSCSKFYNCYNGAAQEQDCGPGLHFDPDKFCTYPHDTECDSGKRPVRNETPAIIFDPPIGSPNSGFSVNAKGQVVVASGKEVGMYCAFPRKWGNPTWTIKTASSKSQVANFWKSQAKGKDYDSEYGLIIRDSDSTNSGNYTCMTPMGGQHTIEIIVQGPPPSKADGCLPLPVHIREGLVVKPDKAFYKEGHMVMFRCEKGYKFKMPFVSKATCIKGGKWTVSSSELPSCIKL